MQRNVLQELSSGSCGLRRTRRRRNRPGSCPDRPGVPFWRAVDFVDDVSEQARAGIEGALLAAGLLSATITADGSVRAASGEILLSVGGFAVAATPLSRALRPDEAAKMSAGPDQRNTWRPSGLMTAPQSPRSEPTGAGATGRCGGATRLADARHIGAQARARRRAARLAEIDSELAGVGGCRSTAPYCPARYWSERAVTPSNLHLRTAPSGRQLSVLRSGCRDRRDPSHRRVAPAVTTRTGGRRSFARGGRRNWSPIEQACAHFDLPADEDALREGDGPTRADADRQCRALADALRDLADRILAKHGASLRLESEARRGTGREPKGPPTESWQTWMHAATELAAQHEVLDLDVAQAAAELERSTQTLAEVEPGRAAGRAEKLRHCWGAWARPRPRETQADAQVEVAAGLDDCSGHAIVVPPSAGSRAADRGDHRRWSTRSNGPSSRRR